MDSDGEGTRSSAEDSLEDSVPLFRSFSSCSPRYRKVRFIIVTRCFQLNLTFYFTSWNCLVFLSQELKTNEKNISINLVDFGLLKDKLYKYSSSLDPVIFLVHIHIPGSVIGKFDLDSFNSAFL
jgi:hypothetical protein